MAMSMSKKRFQGQDGRMSVVHIMSYLCRWVSQTVLWRVMRQHIALGQTYVQRCMKVVECREHKSNS